MLDEIIKILIVFLLFDEIKKRFNLNFRLNDFILLDDIESDIDFNKENANKIIDTENYINYDNIVTTDKILNNIKTNDELINNFPQNFTDCEFSDIYNRYCINTLVEPDENAHVEPYENKYKKLNKTEQDVETMIKKLNDKDNELIAILEKNDELSENFIINRTFDHELHFPKFISKILKQDKNDDEEIIINYSDVVLQNDNITQNNINQNDNITQNDMIQNDNIIQNDMIQNDNVDQEYDTWEKIDKKDI